MKKFSVCIAFLCAVFLTSTTAFAAIHEQLIDGVDLLTIKRLAIAYPNHFKFDMMSDEPVADTLCEMLAGANKSTKFTVIPYADIVEAIKKDTGTDITQLDYRESRKAFEDNVANYANAYLTLTTANNSDPTTFMFKIQDAKTGDVMYLLQINGRAFMKNARGYNSACEMFFQTFDVTLDKELKKSSQL